jgi:transposase
MAKTFREWVPEQSTLLPASVLDWIGAGHLVHFVTALVKEQLDLAAIQNSYNEARGYPPYDPRMMVALLMYAYCQGIYSSRRIARACEERIDFMVSNGETGAGFSNHRIVSAATSGSVERLVWTGVEVVPQSGVGQAGACGIGWNKDSSQCQ